MFVHTPVVRLHTWIPEIDPLSVTTPPIVSPEPLPLLVCVCDCGVSTGSAASTLYFFHALNALTLPNASVARTRTFTSTPSAAAPTLITHAHTPSLGSESPPHTTLFVPPVPTTYSSVTVGTGDLSTTAP